MCEYCAKAKDENEDFELFLDEKLEVAPGLELFSFDCAISEGSEFYFSVWNANHQDEIHAAYIPIWYCPFCGEKLD